MPLIIMGLALMLGGWRMGRICVVLTLAALGAGVGSILADGFEEASIIGLGGAMLLGAFGIAFPQYSPPVLGGLLGTGMVMQLLTSLGLHGWALGLALGLAFLCVAALCWSHQQNVIILITSFEGAALLVSGLVPIMAAWPGLFRFFQSTNHASWIFFPFTVLVPTTVGYFLQLADSRKDVAGAARV
ncbi:MAG: hypothetical protein V2A79_15775 [Planctomycetota bacterium]